MTYQYEEITPTIAIWLQNTLQLVMRHTTDGNAESIKYTEQLFPQGFLASLQSLCNLTANPEFHNIAEPKSSRYLVTGFFENRDKDYVGPFMQAYQSVTVGLPANETITDTQWCISNQTYHAMHSHFDKSEALYVIAILGATVGAICALLFIAMLANGAYSKTKECCKSEGSSYTPIP